MNLDDKVKNRWWVSTFIKSLLLRVNNLEKTAGPDGVATLTGDSVDNTDPLNPIVNAIPLIGTTPGNNVEGDILIDNDIFIGVHTGDFFSGTQHNTNTHTITAYDDSADTLAQIRLNNLDGSITVWSTDSNGDAVRGITGAQDFTLNIQELDFVQKKYVDAQKPYRVYTALLTQTGTDAPTEVVLENTFGTSITWTYQGVGIYRGTATGVFVNDKTYAMTQQSAIADDRQIIAVDVESANHFQIYTYNSTIPANGMMVKNSIEIRVYN